MVANEPVAVESNLCTFRTMNLGKTSAPALQVAICTKGRVIPDPRIHTYNNPSQHFVSKVDSRIVREVRRSIGFVLSQGRLGSAKPSQQEPSFTIEEGHRHD